MKNWVFKGMMLMLASGMALVSCLQVEDFEEALDKKYQEDWIKVLGDVDPNHDWSVAKQVTANFNLAGIANDEQTVRIYTSHPVSRNCYLLAETKINGSGSVSFDIEKSAKEVFIKMEDSRGVITMDGYFTIEGKELMADSRSLSGRSLSRAITYQAEPFDIGNNPMGYDLGEIYYIEIDNDDISNTAGYKFVETLQPIFRGESAVFGEGKNNRDLFKDILHSEDAVEYILESEDEIELSFIYGATAYYNKLGYFYYKEGENKSEARKFILINNARPKNNIKINTTNEINKASYLTDNMQLPNISWGEEWQPQYIFGTNYKLVYYGEDYNSSPTTVFPAGTHVGFFIFTSMGDAEPENSTSKYIFYSDPELNKSIGETYSLRGGGNNNPDKGEISAVTYQYGTYKFLGFEDGIDKDMNDIVFIINGDIKTNYGDLVDLDPNSTQAKPWVIACEDMGSIGDYDFNDAVFSVSHVGGSTEMTVTPLASGGTLPLQVFYGDNNIGGNKDFHQLINPQAAAPWAPINVGEKGTAGTPITIQDVPEDYSVESHGFKVVVEQNNGISTTITQSLYEDKTQKAPQMLTLPSDWIWPKESHKIFDAYPYFVQWNSNANSYKDWYAIQQVNKHLVGYAGGSDDDSDEDNVTGGETGGETTSEWMSYCSEDKKTATIPLADIQNKIDDITNGFIIRIYKNISSNYLQLNIKFDYINDWENNIANGDWWSTEYKDYTINTEHINKMKQVDNPKIYITSSDNPIGNIEISAAN